MPATALKADSMFYNPLDMVESVIMDRDWAFDRPDDGELIADVNGQWCKYAVWFAWQEDSRGLTLSCTLDTKLTKASLPKIYALLALVNEKLWLGHFEVNSQDLAVAFRYSLMVQRDMGVSDEQMAELIDLAVEECERLYPAVQSVVWGGASPEQALQMALFDTIAEA